MSIKINAIVAMDEARVIGADNKMPWHYPEDMKRFAMLTTGHTVLMGRKTYESLPDKFRPLPKRKNIVVSRQKDLVLDKDVEVINNPCAFLKSVKNGEIGLSSPLCWVIGGAQIYQLTAPFWDELYLTRIHSKNTGDAFFPDFEDDFTLQSSDNKGEYSFEHYIRVLSSAG